jgi:hypothetical protein
VKCELLAIATVGGLARYNTTWPYSVRGVFSLGGIAAAQGLSRRISCPLLGDVSRWELFTFAFYVSQHMKVTCSSGDFCWEFSGLSHNFHSWIEPNLEKVVFFGTVVSICPLE